MGVFVNIGRSDHAFCDQLAGRIFFGGVAEEQVGASRTFALFTLNGEEVHR
jgi:hypothetical protein